MAVRGKRASWSAALSAGTGGWGLLWLRALTARGSDGRALLPVGCSRGCSRHDARAPSGIRAHSPSGVRPLELCGESGGLGQLRVPAPWRMKPWVQGLPCLPCSAQAVARAGAPVRWGGVGPTRHLQALVLPSVYPGPRPGE